MWLNWIEYQTTDLRVESSSLSKHSDRFQGRQTLRFKAHYSSLYELDAALFQKIRSSEAWLRWLRRRRQVKDFTYGVPRALRKIELPQASMALTSLSMALPPKLGIEAGGLDFENKKEKR